MVKALARELTDWSQLKNQVSTAVISTASASKQRVLQRAVFLGVTNSRAHCLLLGKPENFLTAF